MGGGKDTTRSDLMNRKCESTDSKEAMDGTHILTNGRTRLLLFGKYSLLILAI